MSIWVMERSDDAPGICLEDGEMIAKINARGINLNYVRSCLSGLSDQAELRFQLVAATGVVEQDVPPVDVLFWSWIPVFSLRAKGLLVSSGVPIQDFIGCRVGSQNSWSVHIPTRGEEVFDLSKSTFSMFIPLTPPLPFGTVEAVRLDGSHVHPVVSVFRSKIPRHEQVLADLFVTDEIVDAWQRRGLVGASFRKVCAS